MKEQTPTNNSIWVINKKLCRLSEPRYVVFLKEELDSMEQAITFWSSHFLEPGSGREKETKVRKVDVLGFWVFCNARCSLSHSLE